MAMDRRRMSGGYVPLRDAMNQLLEGSFITPSVMGASSGFPQTDMHISEDDIVLEIALPGVNPDEVSISVTGDTVTISGEIKRPEKSQKVQSLFEEVWRGRFQRSFQLPVPVDSNKADAAYELGVLTLRLPKAESIKPRKIEVRTSSGNGQAANGNRSAADTAVTARDSK